MSDDKPIGVRVQRPYATREEYLDAEAELLGRSHITLVGTKQRPSGTLLRFEVVLANGEPVIRAEGRVVGPHEFGNEVGLRVKLTRIDNRTKAALDEAAARKAAVSVAQADVEAEAVLARNPSQADTSPPPQRTSQKPPRPSQVPPPLPPRARSRPPSMPPPAPTSIAGYGAPESLPIPEERRSGDDVTQAATQELAALLEPDSDREPASVQADPEPVQAAPEPEPVQAAPEPEPEPVQAAPDPVQTTPDLPSSFDRPEPVTGPHDRNALLARLRSRIRHDA